MLELALGYDQGPIPLKQIASRQEISADYLEQIFRKLRHAGLAKSLRGPHGGFQLTGPPSEIDLWQIVEALEEGVTPVHCVAEAEEKGLECPRMSACAARIAWLELENVIQEALSAKSLQDLMNEAREFCANGTPKHPYHFAI